MRGCQPSVHESPTPNTLTAPVPHFSFQQSVLGSNPCLSNTERTIQLHWATEFYTRIICSLTPDPFVPIQPGRSPLVKVIEPIDEENIGAISS